MQRGLRRYSKGFQDEELLVVGRLLTRYLVFFFFFKDKKYKLGNNRADYNYKQNRISTFKNLIWERRLTPIIALGFWWEVLWFFGYRWTKQNDTSDTPPEKQWEE